VVNTRRCEGTREAPSHTGPKLSACRTWDQLVSQSPGTVTQQCGEKRIVMMAHDDLRGRERLQCAHVSQQ
jgi:hypothetical protein